MAGGDLDVARRLQSGDAAAFGEVVDRYHARLVRFAVTFVHDRGTAEDVVQDTWIAALRGLAGFEGRSSLQTWLFGICANRARSAFTRQIRTVPIDVESPTVSPARFNEAQGWSDPPDPWGDIDARLDAARLAPLVHAAIDELPDVQRQVVTLRDVEGLTSKDVCAVLDISEGNQRVLLHRGRAAVRAVLEKHMKGLEA